MSMSSTRLCLTILLICVIVDTLEGSSWRRHHGHHSKPQYHGFKNPMSLDLLAKLSRNNEDHSRHHDTYRQKERRDYLEAQVNSFPSLEYENADEVQIPVIHRRREVPKDFRQESLQMREADTRSKHEDGVRATQHVRHGSYLEDQPASFSSSEYEDVEEQTPVVHRRRQARQRGSDRTSLLKALHEKSLNELYELEVREVQNNSVCSYTVVPIPDPTGSRIPKVLEEVKCNHAGSSCLGTDAHCCIQTYKNIEVSYGGKRNTIKLYVGCVCAREVLLKASQLPINN
ncbi:uncharacterized protein LOC116847154 [Odontomachus brunneus]|uniref:uncharacterized protein LOC116847154 n=1 Tax=Odontomachus brunneus TaxID=486640 RepID=UPI0013F22288|nr:uncharacterized protein LOC116847154 [Odontomachus brunneus]XP_032677749.1 uncharacterized protein LOC116847154 [Odontomachus brunneus]